MRGCLEDLLRQTVARDLEIIVLDSGSPEREGEIVWEFARSHSNIQYMRTEQRETLYAAWNRGIQLAKAPLITNSNTDDRHAPEAFEKLMAVLENNPNVGVVYAGCGITDEEDTSFEIARRTGKFKPRKFNRKRLFWDCLPGPQPMWRKSLHEEFGYFDENFTSAGDYEFWLRISGKVKFQHVPEELGIFLDHGGSLSHQDKSAGEAEIARARHWPKDWGERPDDPRPLLRRLTSRKTYVAWWRKLLKG